MGPKFRHIAGPVWQPPSWEALLLHILAFPQTMWFCTVISSASSWSQWSQTTPSSMWPLYTTNQQTELVTLTRPFLVTKITLSPKWPYHENVGIPWCMLPYFLQIITFLLFPFQLYLFDLFQLFHFSSQTSSTMLNRYIESQKQPRLLSDFSGTVLRTGLSQWPKK